MMAGTKRKPWTPIIEGDIARIPLSRGLFATVDLADLEAVEPYAWFAHGTGAHIYAGTQRDCQKFFMHTLLMRPAPGLLVDHIDRDGLMNRRCNMRLATQSENCRNAVSNVGGTPFKGVAFHRHSGLYHAVIRHDGRQISLKYHRTPELAAAAYDVAAERLHGAFALTNKALGLLA
jgi:hypothetical protein